MKLAVLAEKLGASLTPAPGKTVDSFSSLEITGVAGLEKAGPHEVSFLTNVRYSPLARKTKAAALLVEPDAPEFPVPTLRVANPYLAFARALEIFHPTRRFPPGVHATAVVSPSARIGARAHLGAYVVVGDDVVIGDDSVLLPHVVIYPGSAHRQQVLRSRACSGSRAVRSRR